MFCEKCGAQIPDNAKFCTSCGVPVAAEKAVNEDVGAITEQATSAAEAVSETAAEAVEAVQENVTEVAGSVQETVSEAAEAVEEKAPEVFVETQENVYEAASQVNAAQNTQGASGNYVPPVIPAVIPGQQNTRQQAPNFGQAPGYGQQNNYQQAPNYNQRAQYQQNTAPQYTPPQPAAGTGSTIALVSMILGICSCVCGCFGFKWWWLSGLGLAAGIVGLIFASKAANAGDTSGIRKAGFICSLIGLIVCGISIIIGISCAACIGCAACSIASSYPY